MLKLALEALAIRKPEITHLQLEKLADTGALYVVYERTKRAHVTAVVGIQGYVDLTEQQRYAVLTDIGPKAVFQHLDVPGGADLHFTILPGFDEKQYAIDGNVAAIFRGTPNLEAVPFTIITFPKT